MKNLSNADSSTGATRWPQYRKFSVPADARTLSRRLAIGVAVAIALIISLRPDALVQQPAVSLTPRQVTLPRMVITAKRERPDSVVMTDSLQPTSTHAAQFQPGASAVKVATLRD